MVRMQSGLPNDTSANGVIAWGITELRARNQLCPQARNELNAVCLNAEREKDSVSASLCGEYVCGVVVWGVWCVCWVCVVGLIEKDSEILVAPVVKIKIN